MARSTSRPRARSCWPRAWPLSPTPTTTATEPLFGHEVVTPLFGVRVPVLAHQLADPEKGSGVAMICTFGDSTDVTWWRELSLPTRTIVGRNGRLRAVPWGDEEWTSEDTAARDPGLRRDRGTHRLPGPDPHRGDAGRGRGAHRRAHSPSDTR